MIKNCIVLVPFPFDDLSASKVRPALCLTNPIGIYNHVIIAFISSRIPMDLQESDYIILKEADQSTGTGLIVNSVIRLHKLVTIPQSLILRKLGEINKSIQLDITRQIRQLFEKD